MDSFEFNKVAGAVLSALLIAFGSGTMLELLGTGSTAADKAGYVLEVKTSGPAASGGPVAQAFDAGKVVALISKADASSGAGVFARCKSCHLTDKGGKALPTGPNLWDVVGRKVASSSWERYSPAMKAQQGAWDYESLVKYLHNPREFIPNNRMSFAGIKDEGQLASLIAYLRSLSESPKPLPN